MLGSISHKRIQSSMNPARKVSSTLQKVCCSSRVGVALPKRRGPMIVHARAGGIASHPDEEASFQAPEASSRVPFVPMAKGGGMGSNSSLGATMERSRLSFVMPTPVVQGPKLDDGGSGNDDGKHNHNGGGGGDDGGDDDDYFGGEDDGEGGDGNGKGRGEGFGFMRAVIPEAYDKLSIAAVFAEWMRTVADLPLIIRRAVEMGLFSSAQLVRFFSMDVRPSIARTVSRNLPPTIAREFVGRLMADPGFAQKFVMESLIAASASMLYEYRARGEKFKQELDLAAINTIGLAAATAATVWLLAPTRSYGSVHKFPWQQMLDGLPNCVFDSSGPLRNYTNQARVGSFFTKMAELSAIGAVAGTATSLASSAAVELRKRSDPLFEPSIAVPSAGHSSGGLAAFFALNANVRYQLIGGLDRYLFGHTSYLWTYMLATGAARVSSVAIGEASRPFWQGLPAVQKQQQQQVRTKKVSKKVSRKVPKQAAAFMAADSMAEAGGEAVAVASPSEQYAQQYESAPEASPSGVSVAAESYMSAPVALSSEMESHHSPAAIPDSLTSSSVSSAVMAMQGAAETALEGLSVVSPSAMSGGVAMA